MQAFLSAHLDPKLSCRCDALENRETAIGPRSYGCGIVRIVLGAGIRLEFSGEEGVHGGVIRQVFDHKLLRVHCDLREPHSNKTDKKENAHW